MIVDGSTYQNETPFQQSSMTTKKTSPWRWRRKGNTAAEARSQNSPITRFFTNYRLKSQIITGLRGCDKSQANGDPSCDPHVNEGDSVRISDNNNSPEVEQPQPRDPGTTGESAGFFGKLKRSSSIGDLIGAIFSEDKDAPTGTNSFAKLLSQVSAPAQTETVETASDDSWAALKDKWRSSPNLCPRDNRESNYAGTVVVPRRNIYRDMDYNSEWRFLFEGDYYQKLKNFAIEGNLRGSRFRSICWRIFLKCLPDEKENWTKVLVELRLRYVKLRNKYLLSPEDGDPGWDLSCQEEPGAWMQSIKDSELKGEIQQDVVRTFPEMKFFQLPLVVETMKNILYCYAKSHEHLSYRQGMHELLAPIVFLVYSDIQALVEALDTVEVANPILSVIMDMTFLEHDCYVIFSKLMTLCEGNYDPGDSTEGRSSSPYGMRARISLFMKPKKPMRVTLVDRFETIFDTILARTDHPLKKHLQRLEISPQLFGIRWIRLLFGREFALTDVFLIWDAMLADSTTLDLLNYVFVAMLLMIRRTLLESDFSSCLNLFMRYPDVGDVTNVVKMAFDIRKQIEPNSSSWDYVIGNIKNRRLAKSASDFALSKQVPVPLAPRRSGPPTRTPISKSQTLPRTLKCEPVQLISKTIPSREAAVTDVLPAEDDTLEDDLARAKNQIAELRSVCQHGASTLELHLPRLISLIDSYHKTDQDDMMMRVNALVQVKDMLKRNSSCPVYRSRSNDMLAADNERPRGVPVNVVPGPTRHDQPAVQMTTPTEDLNWAAESSNPGGSSFVSDCKPVAFNPTLNVQLLPGIRRRSQRETPVVGSLNAMTTKSYRRHVNGTLAGLAQTPQAANVVIDARTLFDKNHSSRLGDNDPPRFISRHKLDLQAHGTGVNQLSKTNPNPKNPISKAPDFQKSTQPTAETLETDHFLKLDEVTCPTSHDDQGNHRRDDTSARDYHYVFKETDLDSYSTKVVHHCLKHTKTGNTRGLTVETEESDQPCE